MTKNIFLIGWVFFGFLSSCTKEEGQGEEVIFTPRQVRENSENLDGHEISVKGFFVYGTNARSLFQSQERYKELREKFQNDPDFEMEEFENDCLTLLNAGLLIDYPDLFIGRTNTLKGIVMADYLDGTVVDLQACGRPALILDEDYLKALILSNKEKF